MPLLLELETFMGVMSTRQPPAPFLELSDMRHPVPYSDAMACGSMRHIDSKRILSCQ